MGAFAPLDANPGRPGRLAVVDADPAQGRKALRFADAPDLKPDWTPIVTAACGVEAGVAKLAFALKVEDGATPTVELRDYSGDEPFTVGVRLTVQKGRFTANGRDLCAARPGVWHDVALALPLSGPRAGRWSLTVTPRGGASARAEFASFLDARFKALTWIGFICYGATSSVWYLDDLRLDTERD